MQTCNHPENVVYIINTLRPLIPNKLISLTYPGDYGQYPYYDAVIEPSIKNLGIVLVKELNNANFSKPV